MPQDGFRPRVVESRLRLGQGVTGTASGRRRNVEGGAGSLVGDGVAHLMAAAARAQTGPVFAEGEHPGAFLFVPLRLGLRRDEPPVAVVLVAHDGFPAFKPFLADAEPLGGLD